MSDVKLLCVVWLGLVVALGITATVLAPRLSVPLLGRVSNRIQPVVDVSVRQLGRVVTASVVYFAGGGVTIAVCWILGRCADHLENKIDWPVFRWFAGRQDAGWSDIWLKLTNIGSPQVTQQLALLGAVVFGVVWALTKRPWWIPPLVFASAYILEKFGQKALKLVVDRGHPPTTLGTWPSGGCARIILIYGLIVFFTLLMFPRASRRMWFAGWAVVAFFDAVQAYARMYNQEHWLTDVIGGMLFGVMLLVVMTSVVKVLVRVPESELEIDARRLRRETADRSGAGVTA